MNVPITEQNSSGVLKIERELREGSPLDSCRGSLLRTFTSTHASPTLREKEEGARFIPIAPIVPTVTGEVYSPFSPASTAACASES